MTTLGRAALLPLLLVAAPALAETPPAQGFPYGTWGQDTKHCAAFAKGQGSNAWQITEKEKREREVEGQLSRHEIVSLKKLDNGHFKLEFHPFKNDPEIRWEELWTDDNGASILVRGQLADPTSPPQKYVACQEKQASPTNGDFGKWKVDLNPGTPRAVLDGSGGFPDITISCTGRDTLGYQFRMVEEKAPRSITFPNANGDITLGIDPSGFMPPKNAARFVGEIASLFKEGKTYGSQEPESAMKAAIGVNGKFPESVPIGGLMAVREALRPLCVSATPTIVPASPTASQPVAPTAAPSPTPQGEPPQKTRFRQLCASNEAPGKCNCVVFMISNLSMQNVQRSEFMFEVFNEAAAARAQGRPYGATDVGVLSFKYPAISMQGPLYALGLAEKVGQASQYCDKQSN